jgi:two-component system response regulator YesN
MIIIKNYGGNNNMRKSKKPSVVFLKFLFSYFTILLIPLVVMVIFVNTKFVSIIKNELIANNLDTLNALKTAVDSQLHQMQHLAFQMELNPRLRPFVFLEDPFEALSVKNELINLKATNNFIREIFIYFCGDNFLYSSSSTYSLNTFISDIYKFEDWHYNDFYKDINSVKFNIIRPIDNIIIKNSTPEKFTTFMFPLSITKTSPYGVAIFLVPQTSFQALIANSYEKRASNIIILNRNNEIIYSLEDNNYELINYVITPEMQYSKTVSFNSDYFLFNYIKSSISEWQYITITPLKEVMAEINYIRNSMLIYILIIIFVGSIAIYYMMYMNYFPINKLKSYSESFFNSNNHGTNEIESIKKTIEYLFFQNKDLTKKIKNNKQAAKESLLLETLKGRVQSREDFNSKSSSADVVFTKTHYSVAVLYISKINTSANQGIKTQEIVEELEARFTDWIECYGIDHIDPGKIILLFSLDANMEEKFKISLLDIQSYYKSVQNILFTIGAGGLYDNIIYFPISYTEAITSVNYRLIKEDDRVIFYNEITHNSYLPDAYPYKEIEKLKHVVKQADVLNTDNIINGIIDIIKENNTPLFIARGICFDIINTVMISANEVTKEFATSNKNYLNTFILAEFETLEELSKIIKKMCFDTCKLIETANYNTKENLTEHIISYINNNFTKNDFSINSVAEYFNMTPSYFSNFFKENTKQTFIDYVTYLKIEKAKQLLVSSNLPLKNIAEQVGYFSTPSFIRRFKQVIGTTPGEYRSIYGSD